MCVFPLLTVTTEILWRQFLFYVALFQLSEVTPVSHHIHHGFGEIVDKMMWKFVWNCLIDDRRLKKNMLCLPRPPEYLVRCCVVADIFDKEETMSRPRVPSVATKRRKLSYSDKLCIDSVTFIYCMLATAVTYSTSDCNLSDSFRFEVTIDIHHGHIWKVWGREGDGTKDFSISF